MSNKARGGEGGATEWLNSASVFGQEDNDRRQTIARKAQKTIARRQGTEARREGGQIA